MKPWHGSVRILLDTNILISGLWIADRPPARLIDLWRRFRFELVTSQVQHDELARVLARPKITRRVTPEEAERLLADLRREAIWVSDLPLVHASPDPDDNRILATAIAGQAQLVVSGDRPGMLNLEEVSGIAIVTAREALERLG
jgi:putative PIN family toxin of toxin-antitoxin system